MRKLFLLITVSSLAACAGAGPETISSSAPPSSPTTTGTPTPTPVASFVNPTEAKTYEGLGGAQHYEYYTQSNTTGQGGQLYAGDANTVRDSGISVTYDPRDAIFNITISRSKADVSITDSRFQDPLHRTAFGGLREPQPGTPQLDAAKNIQYLTSGSSTGTLLPTIDPNYPANPTDYPVGADGYTSNYQTLFYQKPGTTTKYVTYAGFLRTTITSAKIDDPVLGTYYKQNYAFDRSAFVYGERTANSSVPKTGSGTFTGDMIASMVYNPLPDAQADASTYFQWIDGSQSTTVDFASLKVSTSMTGKVLAPALDAWTNGQFDMPAGSTFTATAQAIIDLVGKGGFSGTFGTATFTRPDGTVMTLTIAGSSIDGAFFGPNGEELGGGFRIVGGVPDQRIDILGAYTGKK